MSYPYGQYHGEELSNPTTSLTFSTWETTENEQSQAQVQQQQQQHLQQHKHSHGHDQPSPPSPLTPQQNPTSQLENPSPRVAPSQPLSAFDNAPIHLHHVPQAYDHEGCRESLRSIGRHTTRSSVASTSTVGPTRQTRSLHVIQQKQTHPYSRRPPSAMSSASSSRQQMARFQSAQSLAPTSSSVQASSPETYSPVVPMTAMPSPIIPLPASLSSRFASHGSIDPPVNAMLVPPSRNREEHEPRSKWILRADSWYDPEAKKLRVMLEVPGISKADVRLTLSTCSWNRVKQITVSGVSRPVFPPLSAAESADGIILDLTTTRERRFGKFTRTFAVPTETNREDVEASMENGILHINVSCGIPVAPNAEDVPIQQPECQ